MDRRAQHTVAAAGAAASLGFAACAAAVVTGDPAPAMLALTAGAASAVAAALSWRHGDELRRAEDALAVIDEELAARRRADREAGGVARPGVDTETGLPDAGYFALALEHRVASARRSLKPLTVLLLQVGDGDRVPARAVGSAAILLRHTLREADNLCRLGPATFGALLEDTSSEGAVWTAERVHAATTRHEDQLPRIAAGLATYPTHGLRGSELMGLARDALRRAATVPLPGRAVAVAPSGEAGPSDPAGG